MNKSFKLQKDFLKDATRIKVLITGRRFGKTETTIKSLIDNLEANKNYLVLVNDSQIGNFYKKSLKDVLEKRNIVYSEIKSKSAIILDNKSTILIKSSNSFMRGYKFDYVIIDEFDFMNYEIWETEILPSLHTNGKAIITGTPSKENLKKLYDKYKNNSDYSFYFFKSIDSPYVSKDEIEKIKYKMPYNSFKQEFEAELI